jgi:predicted metal-dependent phosphoesterase TrpH
MRCDLHVHTAHSGMCSIPLLNRICLESYNDPHEVYDTLKARGMRLVTVTDHDSIDAAEALRHHQDFFLSEEVSCSMEGLGCRATSLHMGVYGIEERDHIQLQRRRDDMPSLLAYLDERDLLFSINHVFSSLTGPRTDADFEIFASRFPAVETRNGKMLEAANRCADQFAANARRIAVAGSDAHTMTSLGRTYTEVAGAHNAGEFLAGLRAGAGRVAGESGNYWKLTRAIWEIGTRLIRECPGAAVLSPLLALIPAITLMNLALELAFVAKWGRRVATARPFAQTQRPKGAVPAISSAISSSAISSAISSPISSQ